MDGLVVRASEGRGRGIFATRDFAPGDIIERTPVLVLPGDERPLIRQTVLDAYFFNWGESNVLAFALGYGSLYNHSRSPSAAYHPRLEENWMDFVALKPIRAGDEVTVNYGKSHDDQTPMWFEPDFVPPVTLAE